MANFPKGGIGYPIVGEGERGRWKLCMEGGVSGGGCDGGGDPSFDECESMSTLIISQYWSLFFSDINSFH